MLEHMPGAMRSVVRIAPGAYASLFAFACFFSDAVIFQPRPSSYSEGPPYRKIPAPGGGFVAIRSLWNPDARFTILFSHGRRDGIVAFRHGETLYGRAPSPKMRLWVDGAGHNDVMRTAGDAYWKALAEFEQCVSATARERSAARSPSRAGR